MREYIVTKYDHSYRETFIIKAQTIENLRKRLVKYTKDRRGIYYMFGIKEPNSKKMDMMEMTLGQAYYWYTNWNEEKGTHGKVYLIDETTGRLQRKV